MWDMRGMRVYGIRQSSSVAFKMLRSVILLLIISKMVQMSDGALQYESLGGDSLKFCINVPFKLEITGTTTWKVPPSGCRCIKFCIETTKEVQYICDRPDQYSFEATSGEKITIPVEYCQEKYRWYALPVTNDTAGSEVVDKDWKGDVLNIRVWILDKLEYSTEEKSVTAFVPIAGKSATLTKAFQHMGLRPYLMTYFPDQTDLFFYCSRDDAADFNAEKSYWEFKCKKTTNDRYGSLNGSTMTGLTVPKVELTYQQKFRIMSNGTYDLMGFTVADAYRTFSRPKFTMLKSDVHPPTPLTFTKLKDLAPVLRFDPCNPSTAVVLCKSCGDSSAPALLITSNEFLTIEKFTVNLVGVTAAADVKDFVVTKSFIIVLTDKGLFALSRDEPKWDARSIPLPEPVADWDGLAAADWCTTGSQGDGRDLIAVYSKKQILFGQHQGVTYSFSSVTMSSSVVGDIIDVALDPVSLRSLLMVLLFDEISSPKKLKPISISGPDPTDSSWNWHVDKELKFFEATAEEAKTARLRPLSAGSLQALIAVGKKVVKVSDANATPTDELDEKVTQISTTDTGHRYIQTSLGSIYHAVGAVQVLLDRVQLYSGKSDAIVWIDRFQRLVLEVILPDGTGLKVDKQNLDLGVEILNKKPPAAPADVTQCPYSLFVVNGSQRWYQLDSGQTYRISAELWAATKTDNTKEPVKIKLVNRIVPANAGSKANLVIKSQSSVKAYGDMTKSTMFVSVTNSYSQDPQTKLALPQNDPNQITSITLIPTETNPFCGQQLLTNSFLQAACPIGVSIHLIPQFPCKIPYPSSIDVPTNYLYKTKAKQPFTIEPNLPCESPYYGDFYKPKLGLYYFNQLMEEVPVDFYVFDVNWRKDFTYNSTEIDMGCKIQAQNLVEMSEKYEKPPTGEGTTAKWGSTNYIGCYNSIVGKHGPSTNRAYEILNTTNKNFIKFSRNHTGVFVLVAQILDSNYSFCNLNTKFVVVPQGYGDMPDPMIPVYAWIASVIACVIFYWVVYAIYAVSWNENRVGFDMMQKTPLPTAWHLLTKGENQLIYDGTLDTEREKLMLPNEMIAK